MGMAVGRRSNAVMSEMNITPMIDLLIVLIVIFMLPQMPTRVASFDLQLPIEPMHRYQHSWPFVLEIHADALVLPWSPPGLAPTGFVCGFGSPSWGPLW